MSSSATSASGSFSTCAAGVVQTVPRGVAVGLLSLSGAGCRLARGFVAAGAAKGVLEVTWLLDLSRHCSTCSSSSETDTVALQTGQDPRTCAKTGWSAALKSRGVRN